MCRSQDELKKEASMPAAVTLESVGAIDFTEAMASAVTGVSIVFTGGPWCPGVGGAPRFREAVATFDCVLEQAHEAGSHTLFIGRVVTAVGNAADPLLYTKRAYGHACQ
jgi:hypothetical protein